MAHLFRAYGDGRVPLLLKRGPQTTAGVSLAGLWRGGAGAFYRPSRPPKRRLELYTDEASPAGRLVRETLCSLELPYVLHTTARGSAKRAALEERTGGLRLPHLVDPNVGVELPGATDAIRHLERTYALEASGAGGA